MALFSSYVYIFLIILLTISENKSASSNINVYELAKKKFSGVLNTIANVNDERLNALKRYTELDRNPVGAGVLRFVDDGDSPLVAILLLKNNNPESLIGVMHQVNENNKKTHIISNLRHMSELLKGYYDYETEINSEINKFDQREESNDELHLDESDIEHGKIKNNSEDSSIDNTGFVNTSILRSSCWKKAYKKCKKACKRAYKNVCENYDCSSKFKKKFKKECKYECKATHGYD